MAEPLSVLVLPGTFRGVFTHSFIQQKCIEFLLNADTIQVWGHKSKETVDKTLALIAL